MEKKNNQYNFANLSDTELEQVSSLEKTISKEKDEEVILVAYKEKNE